MALSQQDKKGVVLIAVVLAALAAMFGARIATGNGPRPDADGCINPVTLNTVIILDHSEVVSQQTRREIAARAMAHVRALEPNHRVTVFYVSELSKKNLVPAFSRCKPHEKGNRIYESVKGVEKAFQRDFLQPLDAVLNVAPPDDKESPIAQAVIDVSLSQYLRGKENSLLVFSDLLENTSKFSIYRCNDPHGVLESFRRSRKGAQERPVFKNTSVVLNIIPRLETSKTALACRDKLWPWFFGDNEGRAAKVDTEYLPGG